MKRRALVVMVLLVLAACSADSEGANTSLGVTSTSTSTTSTTTAPTTTTTTLSPTTTTIPATTTTTLLEGNWAEQPVIASGSWVGILGWWNGEAWVARSQGVDVPLQGDEDFQTVGTTSHGRASATGLEVTCEWIEPGNLVLSLGEPGFITPDQGENYEGVAISAPWALQPRSVVENPSDGQHVEFAADVLAGMGLAMDQPLISQILSVDLDGDGVLEKLVTAQDGEITFDAVTEGYSVVFLRSLVGGAAETTVVEGEVVAPGTEGYPSHRAITGVADLNGDGRMEVVLSSHAWETGAITIYELQGHHLVRVLSSGCGV